MNPQSHIAIIGAGLAGSFLAARMAHKGYQVTLIGDKDPHSASRTAAGLFNVITGRHGTKSWMAERLLDEIQQFLEIPLFSPLKSFFHYIPIYRPFREIGAYNKWLGKSTDPEYKEFVDFLETPIFPDQLINPHGGIQILPCGWVDTRKLLDGIHDILLTQTKTVIQTEFLSYSAIDLNQKTIETASGKLTFDELVFCEGHQISNNPFFESLTIIPNKGETLIIESESLEIPFVLSKKIYLIPLGNQQFLTGSTYDNHDLSPTPTQAAKEAISKHLEQAIRTPYRILDHQAGIRPTTPNRKPVIGTHPTHSFVHILTGFGTKGVLLAPYCSKLLSETIIHGVSQYPPEASLNRF